MLLSIFTIGLGLTILYHFDIDGFKKALTILAFVFCGTIFFGVTLKACDREYEYEQAKHAQWKYERENDLPYTSFSGE